MAPSPPLPLSSADLLRTRAAARARDPAARRRVHRPGRARSGSSPNSSARLDLRRPRRPGARARRLPDGRARRRERPRRRPTTTALPRAFLQHLPPPRRAARRRARGPAPAPAVPVPRVDATASTASCATRRSPTGLEDFDPRLLRPAPGPPRGRRGARAARPLAARRRRPQDARRRPRAARSRRYRLAELRRARADRLRRRRQLEGDRRELQRVPALPGRASRSSTGSRTTSAARRSRAPALWCGGSMTLRRGRRDDGAPTARARRARRSPASTTALDPLLPALPQHAGLAAPGLRDAAHAVAAARRTAPRSSASGSSSRETIAAPRLRPVRRRRVLGPGQPRGLGASARSRSAAWSSRSFTPGRYTTQEDDVHAFDVMVAERYLEALR